MSGNSIYSMKDYGKIHFTINKVMDEKQISRNQLAKLADVRFEVASKWYQGNIERMDIDVLTKLCFVLECDITDLMYYERKSEEG